MWRRRVGVGVDVDHARDDLDHHSKAGRPSKRRMPRLLVQAPCRRSDQIPRPDGHQVSHLFVSAPTGTSAIAAGVDGVVPTIVDRSTVGVAHSAAPEAAIDGRILAATYCSLMAGSTGDTGVGGTVLTGAMTRCCGCRGTRRMSMISPLD